MARRHVVVVVLGVAGALIAPHAVSASATVSCPFQGNTVRVVIANDKEGPRSCNATCVWAYPSGNLSVPMRGAGGAMLQIGESKTVYNANAPNKIDGLVTSDITCNR